MSGATSGLAQSLGVVSLKWGGTPLDIESKSASFTRGGKVFTTVQAGAKTFVSPSYVPPKLTAKFPLAVGMSLDALIALNGSEMQIICDSGQRYTMNGAVIIGDPKITGGSGNNVSVDWSGQPALEVL